MEAGTRHHGGSRAALAAALAASLFSARAARTHCDGLDGPVVRAARSALEAGDVDLVLLWVQPSDEDEVRAAFQEAVAVRKLAPQARQLADRHFFETVVRVHRAGEGAPYTGLQPSGRDLGPALPAADKALADGSVEPLVKLLTEAVADGVRRRFKQAAARRSFDKGDLAAGREYVEAYVGFIHYVEGLHAASGSVARDHSHEDGPQHHAH